jgi:hypothetical protein
VSVTRKSPSRQGWCMLQDPKGLWGTRLITMGKPPFGRPQVVPLRELIDDRLLDAGPAPNWHYGATRIANAYLDSRHSYSAICAESPAARLAGPITLRDKLAGREGGAPGRPVMSERCWTGRPVGQASRSIWRRNRSL